MYAIELSKNRYVAHCDECWYETREFPTYYTKEEADRIISQLKNHYRYKGVLVEENGTRTAFPTKVETINEPILETEETFVF